MRILVEATFRRLLEQEDTDGDNQITVRDDGPKRFEVTGEDGTRYVVEGTYPLSNLLQELALARDEGAATLDLDPERLHENPVRRISRMIREVFWDGLTRTLDAEGLISVAIDAKGEGTDLDRRPRVYVPHGDTKALAYYERLARERPELGFEVGRLPETATPEYVLSLNECPGILSLVLVEDEDGVSRGLPFVVPGGRFNELFGWDSYFIVLGLLHDRRTELARGMVDHFLYEIEHYGQILNANRSYFLTRSQPPFLTAMGWAVYEHLPEGEERDAWFAGVIRAAIREYESVWTSPPKLSDTGLSRYCARGIGTPPETEAGHYDGHLKPYAEAAGMDVISYGKAVRQRDVVDPELDEYFVHDRTLRESGHDNSYRLEGRAANLCTVDLNSLLYRYEIDIARALKEVLGGALETSDGTVHGSAEWEERAERRRDRMSRLCWNEERGLFFDYDFVEEEQTGFESVTALYPLWAGLATREQAAMLVRQVPLFEEAGGLASTTEASRGPISEDRPQRQWDYPFGWPPHQVLVWQGLIDYGYKSIAGRLAYRWLHMICENAADYNGTIPEKYDVVDCTHDVFVEYGNVGTEFDYITREGFGWMNASYQVGLSLLPEDLRAALEAGTPPDDLF
jgi:alpha,alpha-trehalase